MDALEQQLTELDNERRQKFTQLQQVILQTDLLGTGTDNDTTSLTVQKITALLIQHGEAKKALQDSRLLAFGLKEAISNGEGILPFAEQLGLPMLEHAAGLGGPASMVRLQKEGELRTLRAVNRSARQKYGAVSYTHLTLPTKA